MEVEARDSKPTMAEFGFRENGRFYWWASWYANVLGYKSLKTLKPSIEKAKKVCIQLGITIEDNFIHADSDMGPNIKLTKFACFLIALQADGRKPIVKRARAFFLNELEDLNVTLSGQDYLNRMLGKDEITHLNLKLNSAAARAHVKDFRFFINEGYLGMYNKTMTELKRDRGVALHKSMNDFMSMTEIAANIFRITLTVERLKLIRNPSEERAAREHWRIGSQIRSMIKENTGSYPEELAISADLKLLQKKLKTTQKLLNDEINVLKEIKE
ncbi:MAG: hypothetical protein P1U56_19150 [Saprospiraceae bacterium]|nr:hypothetical protein [Saprospiraceae bacterium]